MQTVLVMSMWFIFGDVIEITCDVNYFFYISGNDVYEAHEFSCIYTRVQPAIAVVFPVVANTCTKSIQKQVKSIDVHKVRSKKPLASKSCFV